MENKHHIQKLIGTDLTFKMIFIEGDSFDMGNNDADALGNETDIHPVKLSDFYLAEFPVTQELWEFVIGKNPSYFVGAKRPVEQVSWNTITNNFIPALNDRLLNKLEGFQFSLPTEAQWEFVARGGKHGLKYNYKYAGSNKLNEVGWFYDNSHSETKPVGLKTPNLLGLYDMSGNVLEWCEDRYDKEFYKECKEQGIVIDPCNTVKGYHSVFRGRGWHDGANDCRVSNRVGDEPSLSLRDIGFRLALVSSSV